MATKYEPVNLFGGPMPSVSTEVFAPGNGEEFVLTEVILSNTDSAQRFVTVSWVEASNDIYLMYEVPLLEKSMLNLNLYLPLTSPGKINLQADTANKVHATLNGLKLVNIL